MSSREKLVDVIQGELRRVSYYRDNVPGSAVEWSVDDLAEAIEAAGFVDLRVPGEGPYRVEQYGEEAVARFAVDKWDVVGPHRLVLGGLTEPVAIRVCAALNAGEKP